MHSSAAACRRQTSSPAPSDGDRRPAISVTSPRLPGSGRLSVTSESAFNALGRASRNMRKSARRGSVHSGTEIIMRRPWSYTRRRTAGDEINCDRTPRPRALNAVRRNELFSTSNCPRFFVTIMYVSYIYIYIYFYLYHTMIASVRV